MAWGFQCNPKAFRIDDYLSQHPELIYWRTPRYSSEICIGDRAFIWRSGKQAGAVAIGSVVELPTPESSVKYPAALREDLWISNQSTPDTQRNKLQTKDDLQTGIHLDEVRLLPDENMVPRAIVKFDTSLGVTQLVRANIGTVFKFTKEQTATLERPD